LAKKVFKSSRKRRGKGHKTIYRFEATQLPDGVHLSRKLRQDWARNIAGAINRHFDLVTKDYQPSRQDSSEEEPEQDTGNFKRTKSKK
jgi:hypothetical protein